MKRYKKGITLVELVISMMLIGIVSVVSTEFLAQYLRLSAHPATELQAANFARQGMEDLYMNSTSVQLIDAPKNNPPYSGKLSSDAKYTIIQVTATK